MALDFPSSPTNGQSYAGYVYDSSLPGWRNVNSDFGVQSLNTMGMKNVVPTSISVSNGSATVNSNGVVSFTSTGGISLNGVFSNTYRNYRMIINARRTDANGSGIAYTRLMSSGTAISANYSGGNNWIYYSSSTVNSWDGADGIYIAPIYYANYAAELDIYQPYEAIETKFTGQGIGSQASNGARTIVGGEHATQTAYDGLWVGWNAGTWTGNVQILGYTK